MFRVTQDCRQPGTVIVDEDYGDTRWNIPTTLNVTLTANNQACCRPADGEPEPDGTCALITNVCHNPINIIGGNPGASATPEGYLSPNVVSDSGDRPYGGRVLVQARVGSDVEYYEFQISEDDGATWQDMPSSAVGDIPRQYWIPSTNTFQWVPFLTTIDGRLVFESRLHYEQHNDPLGWGATRFWMASNYLSLIRWLTETPYLNGKYRLRMRGWKDVGRGAPQFRHADGFFDLAGGCLPQGYLLAWQRRFFAFCFQSYGAGFYINNLKQRLLEEHDYLIK